MNKIPVVSVVGYSNSGKTTLVVKLVSELKGRGYRIATIKHHHCDFETDVPGKDTWQHARAGAETVILAGPNRVCMTEYTKKEMPLDEILSKISGVDLIVTEGFKRAHKPKIEVFRSELYDTLVSPEDELLAVVSDTPFENKRVFGYDDARGLADLVVEYFHLGEERHA